MLMLSIIYRMCFEVFSLWQYIFDGAKLYILTNYDQYKTAQIKLDPSLINLIHIQSSHWKLDVHINMDVIYYTEQSWP